MFFPEAWLILAGLINIVLGLAVYSRDRRKLSNIFFLLVSLSVSGWSIPMAYYFATNNNELAHLMANIFYGASLGISISLIGFVTYWTGRTISLVSAALLSGLTTSYVWLVALYPQIIVRSVSVVGDIKYVEYNNLGLALHNILFIVLFLFTLAILLKGFTRQDRLKRFQNQYIIAGILSAGAMGMTFNLILPWLGEVSLFWVGPLFSVFFVGFVSYAIARHKLFDFRRTVARATAYLVTLGTLVGLFLVAVYFLSGLVFEERTVSLGQRLSLLGLALIAAVSFRPLKRFFNRVTNKIFYQDAYDPQGFLDELNSTIVKDIELGILLRQTTEVIQRNFRCELCFVEVLPSESSPSRVLGIGELKLNKSDSEVIFQALSNSQQKLILADELDSINSHLGQVCQRNNIAAVARLATGGQQPGNTIAHLIIGVKKSGSIYNDNDVKIIRIIADEMLIAIQNSLRFEEIQGFAARLQNEVNEATAKLQKSNRKLLALDETKDEFISMASHQLRTPLTSVKGYMSMVLEGDAGQLKKQQKELLEQAFVSSQRMVYLIADLLNVSRLKAGKFIIDKRPVNLAEVVESEIAQLTQTAKTKGLKLHFTKPKTFPELMLDETKTRQVIMNFCDNAIYYTPSGGSIKIDLHQDKNNIYFRVKDNGFGVPRDEKTKIFTKFYRASNARKARPDGTGLGLFMAKKAIDAQSGHIIFDSHEGKGSTFGFTFNKKKLTPQPTDQP